MHKSKKSWGNSKMAIEVTDVVFEKGAAAFEPVASEEGAVEESAATEASNQTEQPEAAAAPKRRGRPPGSKDKQPRKRAPRAPAAMEDDIEEVPRPPTRRRATAPSSVWRRLVQVAVDSPESASAEKKRRRRARDATSIPTHAAPPRGHRLSSAQGL